MASFLTRNIKHTNQYNAGGIASVFLLDIRNFVSYQFSNDNLFNSCFVESIRVRSSKYLELDTIDSSAFTESQENGIYKQTLTTFVRFLEHDKTSSLLIANSNKYLIIFRTNEGKTFCFGSDGGASINFSQVSGQMGESSGYSLTIEKNSIYPLFEIDIDKTQHLRRKFNEKFNEKFN